MEKSIQEQSRVDEMLKGRREFGGSKIHIIDIEGMRNVNPAEWN